MGGRTRTTAPITTDPWAAFGYIVSGVAVYGVIGWALGLWLGTRWLIPVGILFGAALGIYMVVARFNLGMKILDPRPAAPERAPAASTDRPTGEDVAAGPATSRGDAA